MQFNNCVTGSGLRFNPDVPVKITTLNVPELSGPDVDQYNIIDFKVSHCLEKNHSTYEV